MTNLTELAASIPPAAVVGTSKTGVSLAEMKAKGITSTFIDIKSAEGMNLVQINAAWDALQKANVLAQTNKPTPAAVPAHLSKEQSDATKKSIVLPWQEKAKPENETIEQELERLRSENAKLLAAKTTAKLGMKVSEKGAVSIYGLGKFPVTLYREQWTKLLAAAEEIKDFMADHADVLKVKE